MSARLQDYRSPEESPEFVPAAILTHLELLRRCVSIGDEEGWNEFVRRFNRYVSLAVVRTLCQHGGRPVGSIEADLVDDLVQDVYVRVLESSRTALRAFRGSGDGAVFVYVGRMAMSVVVDYLRRNGARKRESVMLSIDSTIRSNDGSESSLADYLASPEPSPEDRAVEELSRQDIVNALPRVLKGRNAERDLSIAHAYFFGNQSFGEIAARSRWHLRPCSVKSSLVRTSTKLRDEFARRERRAASTRAMRAAPAF